MHRPNHVECQTSASRVCRQLILLFCCDVVCIHCNRPQLKSKRCNSFFKFASNWRLSSSFSVVTVFIFQVFFFHNLISLDDTSPLFCRLLLWKALHFRKYSVKFSLALPAQSCQMHIYISLSQHLICGYFSGWKLYYWNLWFWSHWSRDELETWQHFSSLYKLIVKNFLSVLLSHSLSFVISCQLITLCLMFSSTWLHHLVLNYPIGPFSLKYTSDCITQDSCSVLLRCLNRYSLF
jgi:hypothetical protein